MGALAKAVVASCVFLAGQSAFGAAPTFDAWAEGFASEWVRAAPQFATTIQYFAGAEQDAVDRQLSLSRRLGAPVGEKASQAQAALARAGLEKLKQFPSQNLNPQQRVSAAVIRHTLEDALLAAQDARHQFVFEQMSGMHIELVQFLTTTHPIRNRRDVENYLARLALVGARLDEAIAESKAAAAAGVLPPRFILERVITQLDEFAAPKPVENSFVTTLDARMAALGSSLPAKDRARFVKAAALEVQQSVLPAYRRARALLAEQLPQSTDEAGVWRLPQGEAGYVRALARMTGSSLTADEIHALGLREEARIEAEMDGLLKKLGHADGGVQDRYERLNASLQPAAEPDPRPAVLALAKQVVQDAERRAATVFDLRPASPVTVMREPALTEKTAAFHYTLPAPDGSKPGIYWMPLADLSPKVPALGPGLRSTAYHEAIPGHHFQLAIQQESKTLPRFRKLGVFGSNVAFVEGWALYAEQLAKENGWYDGDLPGELGYLRMQLHRARRLVVDTGLHAKKWSRQQVIDHGCTPREAERYVVWPGQACAYMLGQRRILALRAKAQKALGSRFSIKEFHNVVLRGGSLPFDVLEQEVDAWVTQVQRPPPPHH